MLSASSTSTGNVPGSSVELDLYSDSNGQPGTQIAILSGPSAFNSNPELYTFTTSGVPLNPLSVYWIVLKGTSGTGPSGLVDWYYTHGTNNVGPGYLGDFASRNGTLEWDVTYHGAAFMMQVAVDTPEPATFLPVLTVLILLPWAKRNRNIP